MILNQYPNQNLDILLNRENYIVSAKNVCNIKILR